MRNFKLLCVLSTVFFAGACSTNKAVQNYVNEPHRPQFHFSPKAHWMNDPNGMVYLNGTYHLFFQYNPDSTVWGPMHWGHATSKDMIHWEEQKIALYPDSLGTIFSGSAVVDKDNTAGFGSNAIVAIFTYHNQKIEDAKTGLHQYQGIAYSTDEGKSWTKYKANPVLPNPGIWDFRDPKVQWYEAGKKWVMTLATKDRITFYSSPDLKKWSKEGDFGAALGAHGGVWECPDLISLDYNGQKKWVLLVSINPGGPNGGSATQYFIGQFDGKTFTPDNQATRWVDYGTDDYAGVTFANTGDRKVFLGWMSNWQYANVVPTKNWRSAMTLPRDLSLKEAGGKLYLNSAPVKEFQLITGKPLLEEKNLRIETEYSIAAFEKSGNPLAKFDFVLPEQDFRLAFSNSQGDELTIGFDKEKNSYYIDRTKAGTVDFEKGFAIRQWAPRIKKGPIDVSLLMDVASTELFADGGLSVMTTIFFVNPPFTKAILKTAKPVTVTSLIYCPVKR